MPFRPVTPEKLSNAVIRQIEQLILRGVLRPGDCKRAPDTPTRQTTITKAATPTRQTTITKEAAFDTWHVRRDGQAGNRDRT